MLPSKFTIKYERIRSVQCAHIANCTFQVFWVECKTFYPTSACIFRALNGSYTNANKPAFLLYVYLYDYMEATDTHTHTKFHTL